MDEKQVIEAIKKARTKTKKRNFKQSFDLILNLKNLNLKKPEENVNNFLVLPNSRGKKVKICGFVGKELMEKAKASLDFAIRNDEFDKYRQSKPLTRKLARDYDFFVAQADLMPEIAKIFGKTLGSRGKMPSPKAGGVVPAMIPDLKPIYNKLQKTVKIETKKELIIKCIVGGEDMDDKQVADNVLAVYHAVVHDLPKHEFNIRNAKIKLTMGIPVTIGDKDEESKEDSGMEKKKGK